MIRKNNFKFKIYLGYLINIKGWLKKLCLVTGVSEVWDKSQDLSLPIQDSTGRTLSILKEINGSPRIEQDLDSNSPTCPILLMEISNCQNHKLSSDILLLNLAKRSYSVMMLKKRLLLTCCMELLRTSRIPYQSLFGVKKLKLKGNNSEEKLRESSIYWQHTLVKIHS
jgi:hypothetical protein